MQIELMRSQLRTELSWSLDGYRINIITPTVIKRSEKILKELLEVSHNEQIKKKKETVEDYFLTQLKDGKGSKKFKSIAKMFKVQEATA